MKTFFRIITYCGPGILCRILCPWWSVVVVCFSGGSAIAIPDSQRGMLFSVDFLASGYYGSIFAWMINQ